MTITTTTNIKPLLNINHFWAVSAQGEILVTNVDDTYIISDEILRGYHEDFPLQLRRSIAFLAARYGAADVNGFDVGITLNYVQYGPITLPVNNDFLLFSCVYKLEENHSLPGQVHIEGHLVKLADFEYQGKPVQAIVCDRYVRVEVPKTTLDESYPGWDKRFEVARLVGLERDAVFNHVFHSAQNGHLASTIKLPPVVFGG